jgi:uncharacterized membrane protein
MKQSEQYYSKESFREKLRQHAMDIMMLSMCLPFVFLMVKYKHMEKSVEPVQMKQQAKSVVDQNQQNIINFTDSIKNKTR